MDDYTKFSSVSSYSGAEVSNSTRTTIPGIGYLSGKVVKRLGEAVSNGVDNVLVNRQLSRIEASVKTDNAWNQYTPSREVREMSGILLELSRPGLPYSIRTRALRIIMTLISSTKFAGLAAMLVELNSLPAACQHLCELLDCLWDSKPLNSASTSTISDEASRKRILALRAAGYESYVASFPQTQTSIFLMLSPFILYLALIAALGSRNYACLISSQDLDIIRFLRSIGLFDGGNAGGVMAGRLLIETLQLSLDPKFDGDAIADLRKANSEVPPVSTGDSILNYMWSQLEGGATPTQEVLRKMVFLIGRHVLEHEYSHLSTKLEKRVKVLLIGCGVSGKVSTNSWFIDSESDALPAHVSQSTILRQLILVNQGISSFRMLYDPQSSHLLTEQELLRHYIMTVGVHRETFTIKDHTYVVWDSGGQRCERKKWGNYYPHTDVLVFVASLVEYDEFLYENLTVNRLEESLELFKWFSNNDIGGIGNSRNELSTCPLVLVFTHKDSLADKLRDSPLDAHFPHYRGGEDVSSACDFFKRLFMERTPVGKNVPVYFISALDAGDVTDLFSHIHREFITSERWMRPPR